MNKGRKDVVVIMGAFVTMIALVLIALPSPAAAKDPITLKWVCVTPLNNLATRMFNEVVWGAVNERLKGQLVVKWAGGPETIRAFDQGAAVKDGIVDIAIIPMGFYEPLVPGIGGAMLTQISLDEERKPGGAYDFMDSMHQKGGLKLLGRPTAVPEGGGYFRLWLNKRVEKPEDFNGLKLGTATVARAAVAGWGATGVSVGMPEYYPALERKIVDGIASSPPSFAAFIGLQEVCKYMVDPPYFSGTVLIIMNLDKWNSLPKSIQDTMASTIAEKEKVTLQRTKEIEEKSIKKMMAGGLEILTLPPPTKEWLLKTAYDATWAYQMERFPKVTPKLKELLSR